MLQTKGKGPEQGFVSESNSLAKQQKPPEQDDFCVFVGPSAGPKQHESREFFGDARLESDAEGVAAM